MKTAVYTTLIAGGVLCAVLMAAGGIFCTDLLNLINTVSAGLIGPTGVGKKGPISAG